MRRELPVESLEGHDAALARAAGVAESRFARVLRCEITGTEFGMGLKTCVTIDIKRYGDRCVGLCRVHWATLFSFYKNHVFSAQPGKRDRDNYSQLTTMFLNFQQISG